MSLTFNFAGRTALVTGAAQGIGLSIAQLFAQAGANVIALDAQPDVLQGAFARAEVLAVPTDVSDVGQVATAVDTAVERFGGVDILVNNAGITRDGMVWKLTDRQWHEVLDVHLTGTFNLTRACVPHMRAGGFGRIVNVTSYTGLHGNLGQANYAAAKAGLIGFTKSVAKEVASFGITVNALSPNAETAMLAAVPDDKKKDFLSLTPMRRFGTLEEMAAAVGFFASDVAGYITGVVLPVDGGMSM